MLEDLAPPPFPPGFTDPTADHAPLAPVAFNPCSACCTQMGCGRNADGSKKWAPRLAFIASVAGSCPGAAPPVVSGILSMYGNEWGPPTPCPDCRPYTCADLAGDTGCTTGWMGLCGCFYAWYAKAADVPLCGPYIDSVILQCLPPGKLHLPNGCPHVRNDKSVWYVQINVMRALGITSPGGHCRIEIGLGGDPDRCFCTKQNSTTCVWEEIEVPCPIDPTAEFCSPSCPPCYDCPDHNARRCAAGEECCGTTGCNYCTCPTGPPCTPPDCDQCSHCIEIPPFTPGPRTYDPDPSCLVPCPGTRPIRYHYWAASDYGVCFDPDDIRGCNATSCPPDTKNTEDFGLALYCNANDYIHVGCP